jgi:putative hydrolase of the HAD superfamily
LKVVLVSNSNSADARAILAGSGLDKEFDAILISGEVGCEKPDKKIFELALRAVGIGADEALMVGNRASVDIAGANNAEIISVWFQ